jgi:CheY-like chemotaxis protein
VPFTPTILLADDNIDDQAFLRDAFRFIDEQVNLQIFDNGNDAISHLKSISNYDYPDLIVLDYNMPKLNGAQVLKILNEDEKLSHIPKVILSTSKFKNFADFFDTDADSYFVKPDNVFDLKQLAADLLNCIKKPVNNN